MFYFLRKRDKFLIEIFLNQPSIINPGIKALENWDYAHNRRNLIYISWPQVQINHKGQLSFCLHNSRWNLNIFQSSHTHQQARENFKARISHANLPVANSLETQKWPASRILTAESLFFTCHMPRLITPHAGCFLSAFGYTKPVTDFILKKLLLYVTHCLSDSINSSVWLCYKIFIKPIFLPFFFILLVTFVSSTFADFYLKFK